MKVSLRNIKASLAGLNPDTPEYKTALSQLVDEVDLLDERLTTLEARLEEYTSKPKETKD